MTLRALIAAALVGTAAPVLAQGQPLQLPGAALPGLSAEPAPVVVAPGAPQGAVVPGGPAPALAVPRAPRPVPLPPRRPVDLDAVATAIAPAGPAPAARTVGQPTSRPAPDGETLVQQAAVEPSPREILDHVNASLNAMTQITADFVQVGGNGRRAEGKLYVQKPGRLRFEYKPPSPVEIVADGSSVVIRDRKLGTQDMYALGQTPLKFLLKDQIDLARDTKVIDLQGGPDVVSATIEDRSTFGGTSRVQMVFDPRSYRLKQWTVVDPQGYQTTVNLQNVDLRSRPDPAIFSIDYQRVLGEGSSNH